MEIKTKNNPITAIDTILTDLADMMSREVAERKFFDKDEFSAFAKAKIKTIVSECLIVERDAIASKRDKLIEKYVDPVTPLREKQKIQMKLGMLKKELKARNIAISSIGDKKDIVHTTVPKVPRERTVIGRLIEIMPIEEYKDAKQQSFLIAMHFNHKLVNVVSNIVKFTLYQKDCKELFPYRTNDIIQVKYCIHGSTFVNNYTGKMVYVTELQALELSKYQETAQ